MCVCVCGKRGGLGCGGVGEVVKMHGHARLSVQPCVTSSICSPAALPSEGGARWDSDMIQGNKHGAASRGPRRAQPEGLDKTQDLFVSTGSRSVCPCVQGGGPNRGRHTVYSDIFAHDVAMWPQIKVLY